MSGREWLAALKDSGISGSTLLLVAKRIAELAQVESLKGDATPQLYCFRNIGRTLNLTKKQIESALAALAKHGWIDVLRADFNEPLLRLSIPEKKLAA